MTPATGHRLAKIGLLATACAPPPQPAVAQPPGLSPDLARTFYAGTVSALDYRAIEAAIPELTRRGLKLEQYRHIAITRLPFAGRGDKLLVRFSQVPRERERDPGIRGLEDSRGIDPATGEARDFLVQLAAENLSVLSAGHSP